jgi:hypothetical protein
VRLSSSADLGSGIAFTSVTFGVIGLVAGLYAVYWLQRKADAYVRDRVSSD